MKKVFITILTLLLFVFGRESFSQTASIKGKITDGVSGNALYEAAIRLMNANGEFVKGALSESDGSFELNQVGYGEYSVEVNFIGYLSFKKSGIVLNSSNNNVDLGTLALSPESLTTEEIEVVTEKPNVEFSGDKLVFNVNESVVSKGESVLDVLRKTPLVTVDENDNISIRGNSSVKILIDGRDSRSFNNLGQMPADLIEKVEVITNPSARYESEGIAGILNLVMKKGDTFGTNGNTNLNYGSNDIYNGGLQLNVNKNGFGTSARFFTGQWHSKSSGDMSRNNLFNDSVSLIRSDFSGANRSNWYFGTLNFDYKFDDKTFAEIFGEYTNSKWKYDNFSVTNNFNSGQSRMSGFDVTSKHNGDWLARLGGVFFNRKFNGDGHDLSMQFTVSLPKTDRYIQSYRTYFDANGNVVEPSNPFDYKAVIDSWNADFRDVIGTLDYRLPLSSSASLEAGYRGAFKQIDAYYLSEYLDNQSGNYVKDFNLSNDYQFKNDINALYSVVNSEILSLGVKAGVRLEHTNTTGNNITSNDKFTKDYTDIFPSLTVSKKFGMGEEVKFSYSRRVNRPNDWQLNPFTSQISPQAYNKGNPELNPEYTSSFELSYMKFLGMFSVTPTAFYRRKTDNISNIMTLTDSNVIFTTFENIGTSSDYGMDLIIGGRPLPFVSINGTISYYRREFAKETLPLGLDSKGYQWNANVNSMISLPEDFAIQLFYNYQGDNVTPMGQMKGFHNVTAGLRKGFLENALNLSLTVRDVFDQGRFIYNASGQGFTTTTDNKFSMRNVNLSLSYRFGEMKQENKPRRKSEETTTAPPPQN